jgi:hypothetical protein
MSWQSLQGFSQATLSAIENDRVGLGVERAKILARALKCPSGSVGVTWVGSC